MENEIIKQLNAIRIKIPEQTYRTILGQIRAGDYAGARVGIQRLQHRITRKEAAHEDRSWR